ncbi:hypothetical protein C8R44DRAFT_981635 [Mycena epipterygia]|nr:hypothetical protein C8R44DRAFT_981635 [Mycena epipterygia]
MKLLARFFGAVGIPALAALAPVFLSSLPPVSASVIGVGPRSINASLIPTECASACQPALSAQSTCGTDLKCLCTDANGHSFAQCIDCAVGSNPDTLAQSAGEGVLSDYTAKCAQDSVPISSLTLSFNTSAPAATGTIAKANSARTLLLRAHPHSLLLGIAALALAGVLAAAL